MYGQVLRLKFGCLLPKIIFIIKCMTILWKMICWNCVLNVELKNSFNIINLGEIVKLIEMKANNVWLSNKKKGRVKTKNLKYIKNNFLKKWTSETVYKNRFKTDVKFRLVKSRIWSNHHALNGRSKSSPSEEFFGIDIETYRK